MVKKWDVTIPKLSGDKTRRAYIWLPEDYEENKDKRYPVMYMFDGHNVFFDEDATYGKSWGMAKYMKENPKDLIIVGVECNHEGNRRLVEYAPMTYTNSEHGHIKGKGSILMNWMVKQLKPYIDENYRTLTDRKNTIIAGSSMGGLIALYGITVYNHIFRQAACLSPSLWVAPAKLLSMIARGTYAPDTAIFLSYGQNEMGNHPGNRVAISSAAAQLYAKGVNLTLRIVRDAYHCEAAWEQEVPIFMECLGL